MDFWIALILLVLLAMAGIHALALENLKFQELRTSLTRITFTNNPLSFSTVFEVHYNKTLFTRLVVQTHN